MNQLKKRERVIVLWPVSEWNSTSPLHWHKACAARHGRLRDKMFEADQQTIVRSALPPPVEQSCTCC